jgi:hypothetical protein
MGRRKIKIERIGDEKYREVTFHKRKVGVIKKAIELSVLCESEVIVLVFHNKHLYQYSSQDPELLLQRYDNFEGEMEQISNDDLVNLKPGKTSTCKTVFKPRTFRAPWNGTTTPMMPMQYPPEQQLYTSNKRPRNDRDQCMSEAPYEMEHTLASIQPILVNIPNSDAPVSVPFQSGQGFTGNQFATTNVMTFQQETTFIPGHLQMFQQSYTPQQPQRLQDQGLSVLNTSVEIQASALPGLKLTQEQNHL